MPSKRILVTGVSKYWGHRLARQLEQREDVDTIVAVDSEDPAGELERTEYVKVGTQHGLLKRIVDAARIDTVVDTRLVVDSSTTSARSAHENNVIGTMNILAACSGPGSTVRKVVFKSSAHYYGAEQDDPAFFTEAMQRPHDPRAPIERDIVEAESSLRDFAEKNPDTAVTVLRFANVLGPDVGTSHTALFSLPAIPMILGFDPRYQFCHEDDVANALLHVSAVETLPGVFNVAGDGVLALSEVIGLLGKTPAPVLPPFGTGIAVSALRRVGINVPPEMQNQLRFGRGVDNRKLKATGFEYRYTTREAVQRLAEHMRLHPILRGVREPYRYEREVEEFLRWSPSVLREGPEEGEEPEAAGQPEPEPEPEPQREAPEAAPPEPPPSPEAPVDSYDSLESEEVISLLGSLEEADLEALLAYERTHRDRNPVVGAIQSVLARRSARV